MTIQRLGIVNLEPLHVSLVNWTDSVTGTNFVGDKIRNDVRTLYRSCLSYLVDSCNFTNKDNGQLLE